MCSGTCGNCEVFVSQFPSVFMIVETQTLHKPYINLLSRVSPGTLFTSAEVFQVVLSVGENAASG